MLLLIHFEDDDIGSISNLLVCSLLKESFDQESKKQADEGDNQADGSNIVIWSIAVVILSLYLRRRDQRLLLQKSVRSDIGDSLRAFDEIVSVERVFKHQLDRVLLLSASIVWVAIVEEEASRGDVVYPHWFACCLVRRLERQSLVGVVVEDLDDPWTTLDALHGEDGVETEGFTDFALVDGISQVLNVIIDQQFGESWVSARVEERDAHSVLPCRDQCRIDEVERGRVGQPALPRKGTIQYVKRGLIEDGSLAI